MGLAERVLRRVAGRPLPVPDYDVIGRIERDLDAERRAEERAARHRAAVETCAHEGHLEPDDDGCEIRTWESPTPLRILPGCPRCGAPADDITPEEIDAAVKLRSAGIL
jgi:hypothetical protein